MAATEKGNTLLNLPQTRAFSHQLPVCPQESMTHSPKYPAKCVGTEFPLNTMSSNPAEPCIRRLCSLKSMDRPLSLVEFISIANPLWQIRMSPRGT
jgi:hypothetical protein